MSNANASRLLNSSYSTLRTNTLKEAWQPLGYTSSPSMRDMVQMRQMVGVTGQHVMARMDRNRPPERPQANKTGLPDKLKAGVEGLSGLSMDDVKVHRNSSKPKALGALAYAQGADIHLGPGQEQHLPHEAWHVVQQKQGRVAPTLQMKGVEVNDDVGLEHEADVMGAKALECAQGSIVAGKRSGQRGLGTIQCVLEDDKELTELDLENINESTLYRIDEEGVGVWEVTIGEDKYVLKNADEPMGETITTKMAGLLGVRVPRICTRKLTNAEAIELNRALEVEYENEDGEEGKVKFKEEQLVLLMEVVEGRDLDTEADAQEGEGLSVPPNMDRAVFLREMGQLAAVDVVLGIGDRFNIAAATCENFNFGNIMVGPVGEDAPGLTGIDYDVSQGLWSGGKKQEIVDRHAAYVTYATNTFANGLGAIVTLVCEALTDSGFEVVDDDNALIMAGVAVVQTRINALSVDDLNAIHDRGNAHLVGYGTHVQGIVSMVRAGVVAVVDDADDAEVAEDSGDE